MCVLYIIRILLLYVVLHYTYNNTPDEISTVDTDSLKNSSKCPRIYTPLAGYGEHVCACVCVYNIIIL